MQKFVQYFDSIKQFAGKECSNGDKLLQLYNRILDLNTGLITLNETHWKIVDSMSNSRIVEFKETGKDED
jgi:hypothetical protein